MTPRNPLTDSQKELQAIVEEAVGNAASKTPAIQAPAASESSEELEEGKRLVRWKICKERGPIFELRNELKEQQRQRERDMKKAIALATFLVALVSGGIQIWGRFTARAEANAEMVEMLKQIRAQHPAQVGAKAP